MRNVLKSTAAWLNEIVAPKRAKLVVVEAPETAPVAEPAPAPAPAPESVSVSVSASAAVVLPPSQAHTEAGADAGAHADADADLPKLSIRAKGSVFYATCPCCESVFNLQHRLIDPRLRRTVNVKAQLTCPKCDQAVATPTPADLRRALN